MKAILLAAGFGTRLRPLTDMLPKCLVPIDGEPLLGIWLRQLSAAGIGPFLVNTHYLSEQVASYLKGSAYASAVTVCHEDTLLGTAGTLMANLEFFDGEDGLLIHADNWCTADFREFVRAHTYRSQECLMTMMTFRTDNPSACGIVEINSGGVVQAFHEKAADPPGNLANGAVYLLDSEFQLRLRTAQPDASDFSTMVLPHYVGYIQTYETRGPFLDIGTPEAYAQACTIAASQRKEVAQENRTGRQAEDLL